MFESLKRKIENLFSNDYSNIFALLIVFLILLVGFIVIFKLGVTFIYWMMSPSETPYVWGRGFLSSNTTKVFDTNPNSDSKDKVTILRSKNQSRGIEFTWSSWIYIDGYNHEDINNYIHIFNKGARPNEKIETTHSRENTNNQNLPITNAPGAYIYYNENKFSSSGEKKDIGDVNENSLELRVMMDIQENPQEGSIKHYEEVRVPSFPINKWVHVVIRCMNHYLDIYINGRIKKRHILSQLPRQNYGNVNVHMPLLRTNGTSDTTSIKLPGTSKQSDLRYFAYALDAKEIEHYTEKGPTTKPAESTYESGAEPYYLHQVWHFKDYHPSIKE